MEVVTYCILTSSILQQENGSARGPRGGTENPRKKKQAKLNNTKYLTKLYTIRKLFTFTIYTRRPESRKSKDYRTLPLNLSRNASVTENEDNSVRSSFRKDFRV